MPTRIGAPAGLGDPEAAPVRAAGQQFGVLGGGERGPVPVAPRVVEPPRRHDLGAVPGAVLRQHLPEARQVAQAAAEAAVEQGAAGAVEQDVGVVLGAEPAPDLAAQKLGHGRAAGALHGPAEHVGVERHVLHHAAVLALLHRGRGVLVDRAGLVHGASRLEAAEAVESRVFGVGVLVVLHVADADRHVEEVAHRRPRVGAVRQLRHVVGDRALRVEQAALGEVGGHARAERLGDGVPQVRRLGPQAAEVPLAEHLPAPQHQDAVRVADGQHLRERPGAGGGAGALVADVDELDVGEVRRRPAAPPPARAAPRRRPCPRPRARAA